MPWGFLLVRKIKLRKFISDYRLMYLERIDHLDRPLSEIVYKLYSRKGRKDLLVLVPILDLYPYSEYFLHEYLGLKKIEPMFVFGGPSYNFEQLRETGS